MAIPMKHYIPDLYCSSVADIPFAQLADLQKVNICLDVDNTLALRSSSVIDARAAQALAEAKHNGYINEICIVSNIIWGRAREERVRLIAQQIGTEHYVAARFWERKPGAKPFLSAMRMMNAKPENTAIIGDQIFTDIAGGKKLGLYTVLVRPLGDDHWTTFITGRRRREKKILCRLDLK
ncbi:MAG: YqeG family HAD IIIA-type phosphatase [Candidatus Bruticola sp.]